MTSSISNSAFHCPHVNRRIAIAEDPFRSAGTTSVGLRWQEMDRIFLAIIVSGLLLAATSMSLLVATGGGTTVAELNVPQSANVTTNIRPQRPDRGATLARDDSAQ